LYTYCINKDYTRIRISFTLVACNTRICIKKHQACDCNGICMNVHLYIRRCITATVICRQKGVRKKYKMLSVRRNFLIGNFVIENFDAANFCGTCAAPCTTRTLYDYTVLGVYLRESAHTIRCSYRSCNTQKKHTRDHAKKDKNKAFDYAKTQEHRKNT
jgi:hypothetical protein